MASPLGKILLEAENEQLIGCKFILTSDNLSLNDNNMFLQNVQTQLTEYFSGKRKNFNIKLAPHGTIFQKKVWHELQKIPYGETTSYKDIAQNINNPLSYRAVGMANNKNPIAIIIPCHRVIGSSGKLVGYAGGIKLKEELLQLEQNNL